jgi:hypothetical protein
MNIVRSIGGLGKPSKRLRIVVYHSCSSICNRRPSNCEMVGSKYYQALHRSPLLPFWFGKKIPDLNIST